jgi:hypothetical protein
MNFNSCDVRSESRDVSDVFAAGTEGLIETESLFLDIMVRVSWKTYSMQWN